jgi:alanine dehydrogenase
MDISVPRETRPGEHRAGLSPAGVRALVEVGHRVWVQSGAGERAGFADGDYAAAGASIAYTRQEALTRGEILASVYPPEPSEFALLRPGQVVLAFWALPAARREDLLELQRHEVTVIGLEAIADRDGHAPVLKSMSEIAGGLAISVGANLLLTSSGGKGLLLGGAPGVPAAHVAILGAGVLGRAAARAGLAAGAQVLVMDKSVEALRGALESAGPGVATMLVTRPNLEKALAFADLLIGAVAVRGERAPVLVTRPMLALMKPRSVVMDLSIDMGGCVETSRPTAFPDASYEVDGILHFCVPNLPAAAARSSTVALTNAVLPYLLEVGAADAEKAVAADAELRRGIYLYRGRCAQESLARMFGLDRASLPWAMG